MKPHFMGLLAATAIVGCDRTPPSLRTFVAQVYAAETQPHGESLILSSSASLYFTPELLELVKQDQAHAGDGYVGFLDYDPLCSCQDTDGMQIKSTKIVMRGPTAAIATVTLDFGDHTTRTLQLYIRLFPQGWRIFDVHNEDTPSLSRELSEHTSH